MPTIKQQLADLPGEPGIYRYYAADGSLLYIGKAANLKRRVSSYFQKSHDLKTEELVHRIDHMEYTTTDSVIEALLLEANQISIYQPPFNIRLKDDKSFVNIGITKEDFPRILIVRPTEPLDVPLHHQFGPYTSAGSVRIALHIIRRIFPFRTKCKVNPDKLRGCLDYQIGLCPGPCAGAISQRAYRKLIGKIVLFIKGGKKQLITELERDMKQLAKKLKFEEAGRLRNQLFALQHIQDVALIRKEEEEAVEIDNKNISLSMSRIECYDISNISSAYAVGSMVVMEQGKPNKKEYRKFQIKTVIGQNDVAMMEEVLTRRFRHIEWAYPQLLLVDGGKGHLAVAKRVLRKFSLKIPAIGVAKGPDRKKLDLHSSDPKLLITHDPSLITVIRMARDEAHRFAITYHRTRRDKQFLLE